MSSLRITSQSRAIAEQPSASGEAGREDVAAGGVSFAAALGASASAPGGGASAPGGGASAALLKAPDVALLAGQAGDPLDGAIAHKHARGAGEVDAAAAGAAALLGLPASLPDVAPAAASDVAGSPIAADGAVAAGAGVSGGVAPAAAGKAGAVAAGAAVARLTAGAMALGADRVAPPTAASATLGASIAATYAPTAVGATAVGATAAATGASQPASDAAAAARLAAGSLVARDPAAIASRPTTSSPASDPTGTGAMDASAVVSGPTPVMPDVPGAAARPAQPLNLAAVAGAPALAQMQPVAAGNGNGGTGGDDRGRFAQAFAAADPGIVGALNGNRGAAAAVNPPVAANTGPTLEAPGSVADQVSGQLVRLVSGDSREMVMRLHPPDLGDLTVRVAVSGRDVQAWFESPQPQVQVAISQAIGQLHADLGSAGYSLNGAWVGADASNARRQGMAPPVPLPARDIAEPPGFGRAGAAAPRSSASGLNIYV